LIGDSVMQHGSIREVLMPAVYVCHMMREFPDPTAILQGSNLLLSDIELPGRYITVEQNLKCVANAMKLARSPQWYLPWGLRIAEYIHGPLTPALLTAPTLGDGLDVFLEYFELRIPYMGIRSRLGAGQLEIDLTPLLEVGELLPLLVEIPFLILQHYIGTVRAAPMREARMELAYAPVAPLADYRRWFECAISFQGLRNRLNIPARWRTTPNLGYDPALWQTALRQCAELADVQILRHPLPRVRAELQRMVSGAQAITAAPTLEEIARRMNTSPRTLIRRLRAAGTTFQVEIDAIRQQRAMEMLQRVSVPVSSIAETLGFADSAGFAKAFKRWTGVSPSNYRKSCLRSVAL
jgi:AraC-like DNA-binding protein